MKADWEFKALGEVCDFKGGSQPPKSQFIYEPKEGYIRMLQIRDFKSDDKAVYIPITKKTNACAVDDIMIGRYGASVGQIHRGKAGAYNVALIRTIPDLEQIDRDYLYHYLTSDLFQKPLMFVSKRGAQDGFSKPDIAPIPIPLPPLDEQKRIVAVLDAAFDGLTRARANVEANLQNARELFESIVIRMFSNSGNNWVEAKLKDVCDKITDGTHQTPKYFDNGYTFLSSKNVKNGELDWDNVKYIDEKQHIAMQKRLAPRLGDVLLRKNGAGYGKAAIVDRDVIFDVYVSLAVLRPLEMILPEYLLHYVNSPVVMKQFNNRIKGQGVPNLHLQEIREVDVLFPRSLTEQQGIVDELGFILSKSRSAESLYQSKLADLDELRQSLLQKAFAGELT